MRKIYGVADATPVKGIADAGFSRVIVADHPRGVVILVDGNPALLSWEQGQHIAKSIMEVLAKQDCPSCKQPWETCPCEPEKVG